MILKKRDLIDKIGQQGFLVDNRVFGGFEENNQAFLEIDGELQEVNAFSKGLMRVERGLYFFDNPNTVMSKDSRNGFLYQETDIVKQYLLEPKEDVVVQGMDITLKANQTYVLTSKGTIEEISESKINALTWYDDFENDKKVKKDKFKVKLDAVMEKRREENAYSEEMKQKSSLGTNIKVEKTRNRYRP